MLYRFCTPADAALLAPLNLALILDEGHCNAMDVGQLEEARMSAWLQGE